MPIASEVGAAFRVRVPPVLVRGADSGVRLESRLGPNAVTPSAASYRLAGPTGDTLHTENSPTISGGVVSLTVPASVLPATLTYGGGYREFWTLTIDGVEQVATRPAYLAAYPLHCPVTQLDLENEYPDIATSYRGLSSMQEFIDAAWADTVVRMLSAGKWPEAVVDVETLIPYVRESALYRLFRSLSRSEDVAGPYSRLADDHRQAAATAWGRVSYRRDDDQDGIADSDDRHGTMTILRRAGGRHYEYRSRRFGGRKVF